MSSLIDQATIKNRRDSASNWTSNDPVLNAGEFGYETDTGLFKIGDGSTAWTSLLYSPDTERICKAWVNFNGTGTVAIRDSYNVSSITDNGVGDYTINISNNFIDANRCVVGNANASANDNQDNQFLVYSITTSAVRVLNSLTGATAIDRDFNMVAIF